MEDLDWCHRFWDAGWKVFYEPARGGTPREGRVERPRRAPRQEIAFHRGMGRFYRRFDAPGANPLLNLAVYAGIGAKLAVSLAITALRGRGWKGCGPLKRAPGEGTRPSRPRPWQAVAVAETAGGAGEWRGTEVAGGDGRCDGRAHGIRRRSPASSGRCRERHASSRLLPSVTNT